MASGWRARLVVWLLEDHRSSLVSAARRLADSWRSVVDVQSTSSARRDDWTDVVQSKTTAAAGARGVWFSSLLSAVRRSRRRMFRPGLWTSPRSQGMLSVDQHCRLTAETAALLDLGDWLWRHDMTSSPRHSSRCHLHSSWMTSLTTSL